MNASHRSTDPYHDGEYLRKNPGWHVEDSAWKANQIIRILARNRIEPSRVCEVGCGAGETLRCLAEKLPDHIHYRGFDISHDAVTLARSRAGDRVSFELGDPPESEQTDFDLVLIIDVVEHVDDYIGFLRKARRFGSHKVLHFPLDLSVQSVLRSAPILEMRNRVGHLHYFTKDTVVATLEYAGHRVVDWAYTAGAIHRPKSWRARLASLPRRMAFALAPDLAVRTLGGYSLIVLTR
jgi:ubiquinone/menaquinone biosynthesis C-methylase UbiE